MWPSPPSPCPRRAEGSSNTRMGTCQLGPRTSSLSLSSQDAAGWGAPNVETLNHPAYCVLPGHVARRPLRAAHAIAVTLMQFSNTVATPSITQETARPTTVPACHRAGGPAKRILSLAGRPGEGRKSIRKRLQDIGGRAEWRRAAGSGTVFPRCCRSISMEPYINWGTLCRVAPLRRCL